MDQNIVRKIALLCDMGFSSGDARYYAEIDAQLKSCEQTEEIEALRRLTRGGPSFSSKRFAYPHIKDRLIEAARL